MVDAPLSVQDIEAAVAAASRRSSRAVIDAALSTVSAKGVAFLRAMSEDDGPTRLSEIGRRLGSKSNTVGNYRARLIDAGLIQAVGHGLVTFAIPGMRAHFRRG